MIRLSILAVAGATVTATLVAAPLEAATTTWSVPEALSRASAAASRPDVAAAGNGDAMVVWRETTSSGARVVASWRDAGGPWSDPKVVSSHVRRQSAPQVAMNQDTSAVVWVSASGRVMERQRGAGGWTTPKPLSPTSEHPGSVDVAVDGQDDVAVVWSAVEQRGTVHASAVRGIRRLAGHGWGRSTRLSGDLHRGRDDLAPVVAMAGDTGLTLALWRRVSDTGFDSPIVMRQIAGSGSHWQTRRVLAHTEAMGDPLVAMNGAGDAAASWIYSATEGMNPRAVAGTRAAGGTTWDQQHLSPKINGSTVRGIALDTAGDVTTTWESYEPSTDTRIQVARRPAGSGWQSPDAVSDPLTSNLNPGVASSENGDTTVVWVQLGDSGDDVMAVRRPQGDTWTVPETVSVGAPVADVDHVRLAMDAVGNTVVAWVTKQGGTTRIVVSTG